MPDHHQDRAGEATARRRAPRSCSAATGGGSISCAATTTNVAPTIQGSSALVDVVDVGGEQTDGADDGGDGQRGEEQVDELEHVPRVELRRTSRGTGRRGAAARRARARTARSRIYGSRLKYDKGPRRSLATPVALDSRSKPDKAAFPALAAWACPDQALRFCLPTGTPTPLLSPGGVAADTARPPGVPFGRDQRRRRLGEVTPQRSRPVALQPPHERDVVGCHPFRAPERFELVHEQLQLAVERRVRGRRSAASRPPRRSRGAARCARR